MERRSETRCGCGPAGERSASWQTHARSFPFTPSSSCTMARKLRRTTMRRVGGPDYVPIAHHDVWRRGIFAHTSSIYVAVGDEWSMADGDGLQYLLTLV